MSENESGIRMQIYKMNGDTCVSFIVADKIINDLSILHMWEGNKGLN